MTGLNHRERDGSIQRILDKERQLDQACAWDALCLHDAFFHFSCEFSATELLMALCILCANIHAYISASAWLLGARGRERERESAWQALKEVTKWNTSGTQDSGLDIMHDIFIFVCVCIHHTYTHTLVDKRRALCFVSRNCGKSTSARTNFEARCVRLLWSKSHVYVYVSVYVYMHVLLCVCRCVSTSTHAYVCMYVCMHVL